VGWSSSCSDICQLSSLRNLFSAIFSRVAVEPILFRTNRSQVINCRSWINRSKTAQHWILMHKLTARAQRVLFGTSIRRSPALRTCACAIGNSKQQTITHTVRLKLSLASQAFWRDYVGYVVRDATQEASRTVQSASPRARYRQCRRIGVLRSYHQKALTHHRRL